MVNLLNIQKIRRPFFLFHKKNGKRACGVRPFSVVMSDFVSSVGPDTSLSLFFCHLFAEP